MSSLAIVPATPSDLRFLVAMLREAAFWRDPATAPEVDEVLRRPELTRYVQGWGRPGDRGLVATVADTPVGAVWLRRFAAEDAGYGFIDASIPELSIAVDASHRGLGIGRCLLEAMLVQARLDGPAQISLSVETDNPAHRLYQQVGFRDVEVADGAATMLVTLRPV